MIAGGTNSGPLEQSHKWDTGIMFKINTSTCQLVVLLAFTRSACVSSRASPIAHVRSQISDVAGNTWYS